VTKMQVTPATYPSRKHRPGWALISLLCLAFAPGISAGPVHTASEPFAFQVRVSLSERAAATLHHLDEGIVISASYSGKPRASARQHADQIGQIPLGSQNVEVPGKPATVIVNGSSVKRGRLAWVHGPVLLNVNVYSARRSGPNNILACDFFDGRLRNAFRQAVQIHCSLIEEKAEVRHRS
jgi:hypothetical protein